MHNNNWNYWPGICLSMVALCGAAARAETPAALAKTVTVDIKSQPIGAALNELARQSGMQVIFYSDVTQGIEAPAIAGTVTPEAALRALLSNTGLTYSYVNPRTVLVQPANGGSEGAAGTSLMRLAALRVPTQVEAQKIDRSGESQSQSENKRRNIEEVIVTAQKRSERLQDVPISIGVVTADDIVERGLFNASDYLRGIAGVSQMDSAYGQSVVIRGIETSPFFQNFFSSTTTATYFGETPTTTSAGLLSGTNVDLKLVDISRVEVLRGPQGTAFGSSSLGGAVRTIPVAPKLDSFEGRVAASYSSTADAGGDNYNVQVIGNIPLIEDRLAIRAVGYQYQDSGFYRNRAGSDPAFEASVVVPYGVQAFAVDKDEVGDYYVRGGRIAALWQANDDLRLTLNYLSQKNETDGMPLANSGVYEQTALQVATQHVVRGQTGGQIDMDVDILNPVVEYRLGWGDLIATYSYTKSHSIQSNPWAALALNQPVSNRAVSDHVEHVGEVRVTTRLDSDWNFLAGVYVEDIDDDSSSDNRWYGDPATNLYGTDLSIGIREDRRSLKQKAVFGEVSWEVVDGLTLTGGVRAYDYERTFDVDASGFLYSTIGMVQRQSDASGQTYRANVSYKLNPDFLVYAGWAQGFRLGQAQIGLPSNSCDVDGDGLVDGTGIPIDSTRNVNSDEVDSYEIGTKFSLLERRLSVEAAIFRMEWSGVPVQVRPGSGTCVLGYVANAGESVSEGVELQASFQITDVVGMTFGGSWIDSTLSEAVPALNAAKGNRLTAPEVNANVGLKFDFSIGRYEAFARADAVYVGSFYGDLAQSPSLETDDYTKLDTSAGMAIGNLNVDLFVRNLTNENAMTFRGTLSRAGQYFGYRLRPRTIGLQLSYNF